MTDPDYADVIAERMIREGGVGERVLHELVAEALRAGYELGYAARATEAAS